MLFVGWSQGKLLVHNISAGVIISDTSLVLQRVSRLSAGRYTCHASNAEGDGSSAPYYLNVARKLLFLHCRIAFSVLLIFFYQLISFIISIIILFFSFFDGDFFFFPLFYFIIIYFFLYLSLTTFNYVGVRDGVKVSREEFQRILSNPVIIR